MSLHVANVIFDSRQEVENVINDIDLLVKKYGYVTVTDLYDLVGATHYYTDNLYGWASTDYFEVVRCRDGYQLKVPTASLIGKSEESMPNEIDMVNHPAHYKSETGLETIDVIEAFTFDLKGIKATDTGNILKYMCRWKNKNGLQDLKKAQWYLNHLIKKIKKMEKENA